MSYQRSSTNKATPVFLTTTELQRLLFYLQDANVSRDLRDLVTLVRNTGMRLAEVRKLQWADIDANNRTILVRNSKTGDRLIPFNFEVNGMLALRAADATTNHVFGSGSASDLTRELQELESLAVFAIGRSVSYHDLRAKFISEQVEAGMTPFAIMGLLGWSSPAAAAMFFRATSQLALLRCWFERGAQALRHS